MEETETQIKKDIINGDLAAYDESTIRLAADAGSTAARKGSYITYALLPLIFLTVMLLGGMRIGATDNEFIFLKPALVALVFAALTLVLFVRSGLLTVGGWLNENYPLLRNAANAGILATLFAATVQLFSALLPEQGLTFWIVGFCFFWTIWNNLFADFDPKRLLRSMIGLFGLAFVVKYLVLANITAAPAGSWWQRIFDNPGKEAFTWLLDLPVYSSGTGYIQFFTLSLYLIGLFLIPRKTD